MATKTKQTENTLPAFTYPPEVEARRAEYEKLRAALSVLWTLATEAEPFAGHSGTEMLDPDSDSGFANSDPRLIDALHGHYRRLAAELDWYHPVTLARFYVELRLHMDWLKWERQQLAAAALAELAELNDKQPKIA